MIKVLQNMGMLAHTTLKSMGAEAPTVPKLTWPLKPTCQQNKQEV